MPAMTTRTELPTPHRLDPADIARTGSHGLRTRPLRAALAALGIAIGIAALVAVVSIPASTRQALSNELAALGTNLLTASPGASLQGGEAKLPETAVAMVRRIAPVIATSATGSIEATVRRTDQVPVADTSGIAVAASRPDLLTVLGATVRSGRFHDQASESFPTVVLGALAASRLGVGPLEPGENRQVWLGNQWFTVIGILDPIPLAPELDRSALVGWPVAESRLGFTGNPTTVYVTAEEAQVEAVREVLGRTISPERPNEVDVSRPSEALAAARLADSSFDALFLGLGGVAVLVGGVGVANTMVISVLERRREIGLRRALGASRGQVRGQFLAESVLLSLLGGLAGVVVGAAVTVAVAVAQGWPAVLPLPALLGGVGVASVIGAIAGAFPAARAAKLSPSEALVA